MKKALFKTFTLMIFNAVTLPMAQAKGFYGEAGLGLGVQKNGGLGVVVDTPYGFYYKDYHQNYTNHLAAKFGLGYDVNDYFGIEVDYQYFANHSEKYKAWNGYQVVDQEKWDSRSQAAHLLFVGNLPITEKVTVFGKLGPGVIWDTDNFAGSGDWTSNQFSIGYGAGAKIALTEKLDASLEYLGSTGGYNERMHGVYANLIWHFK